MARSYRIRLSPQEDQQLQVLCALINNLRPANLSPWSPENLVRFLVARGTDVLLSDDTVLERFVPPLFDSR